MRPGALLVLLALLSLSRGARARFGDRLGPRLPPRATPPSTTEPPPIAPIDADVYKLVPPAPPERHAGLTEAHRLEMSTEFFVVPDKPPPPIVLPRPPPTAIPEEEEKVATVVNATAPPPPSRGLRREPWALPLLGLSSCIMLLMAAFEVFVLCKVWRAAPSRRHLFLGQMLLLGLFSCAAQGALLAASPSALTCAAVRFGAGVSLALVFSALLVKCVFLISLNGGVYLPAPYQALLLFFAVMIQVAIGAQWLGGTPPRVSLVPPILCRAPFGDLLLSFVYVAFLASFVGVLAVKSRGIRDNHREAGYIAWAAGGAALLAAGWAGGALLAAPRHRDGWLGGGMALTAALVFLVMFAPKGRQLAALGKGGEGTGEREERLSSLSRAGSGYSPSFFHFKPVKYGVVGAAPAHTTAALAPTAARKQPAPQPPAGESF